MSASALGITDTEVTDDSTSAEANATSLASEKKKDDKLGDTSSNATGAVVKVNAITPSA